MRIDVQGADRFRVVARKLRTAHDRKDLVRELRKSILDAVPELKDAVRTHAPEYLPDRYAEELIGSMRMTTSTVTTGDQVTVTISATATGRGGSRRHIGDIEAGTLRHPAFGRTRALKRHAKHRATSQKNPWVVQRVRPGMVTEPMAAGRPAVRQKIEQAVDRVLDQIAKG